MTLNSPLTVLICGLAFLAKVVLADTCDDVAAQTDITVSRPLDLSYIDEQNNYWSESCSLLLPTCIFFPATSAEVAAIVKILASHDEQFAVKSGGHNPNNWWSSVEGGPLISMSKLDHVILDQQTGVLQVGPGQRLDSIAAALDGTGWTFVGGRIGNTGIGGLILGGGLSYMSAQHGWSASSIDAFEVVLANGSVVTASNDENSDLSLALKGGGNNFGIITSYTVQTYRQGDVWGGNLAFLRTPETDQKLLQAVRDFTEYNDDDKAAIIVTAERGNVDLVDSWIIFLFYDSPMPPEGLFQNFTDAGPILSTLRTQSYAQLIGGSNWVIVEGSTVLIGTETMPIPSAQDAERVFDELHTFWREISSTVTLVPGIISSIAYQPFPKRIAQAARDRGPDLIDTDPDANKLIIEINYSFLPIAEYDNMADVLENTYTGYRERIVGWQEDGTLPSGVDLPVFMSYGSFRQDYWARLKPESRAHARDVSEKYDPEGLFRNRTGGWKP